VKIAVSKFSQTSTYRSP